MCWSGSVWGGVVLNTVEWVGVACGKVNWVGMAWVGVG